MSWNECLYHYHTQVGGQYFGNLEEAHDGVLLLEHRGVPMMLKSNFRAFSRGYSISGCVSTNVTLERAYELRIRDEGVTSKGLGTIRGLIPNQSDFGQPDLARKRNIGASDNALTKLVLQDLDLRNHLAQCQKMKVTVLPSSKEGTTHLVSAIREMRDLDWDERTAPFTEGAMLQPEQKDDVIKYLNEMLDLCYYASRAVQAYRMPEKTKE